MRRSLGFAALVVLGTACASTPDAPPSRPSAPPKTVEPNVDMACVARGKAGTLISSLPTSIDGFDVTSEGTVVTLHRPGRGLIDAEGSMLWGVFSNGYFSRGGLAGGSNGLSSIYTCPHAGKAGCFHLEAWACQTSLETLVSWFREATDKRAMGDAELELVVDVLEARGPACKAEPCLPSPHYSTKNAVYDPSGARHASEIQRGTCETDGDCMGAEMNGCLPWYLVGGAEEAIYIQWSKPAFCGCVDRKCTWFTQ